ncbi:MAG: hypothetical protein WDA75_08100 [Candidatus Latescibacterota bacterium]|jgi:hypothetical protein
METADTTAHPDRARAEHDLAAQCSEALTLSLQVADALRQGMPAAQFLPLLRREAHLSRQVHAEIARLSADPGQTTAADRDASLVQLRAWVDQTRENHRLLSCRGIRLSGPGPYRYRASRP